MFQVGESLVKSVSNVLNANASVLEKSYKENNTGIRYGLQGFVFSYLYVKCHFIRLVQIIEDDLSGWPKGDKEAPEKDQYQSVQ